MKKLFLVTGLCAAVLMSIPTDARAEMGLHLGVEGAFVLPLGDWGDATGIGLGGMAKVGYEVVEDLQLTFRIGYIYHLSKEMAGIEYSTSEMPILIGARYTTTLGLFGELAIGPVNYGVDVEGFGSDSEMKFGLIAGAGYSIASFSVAANIFIPSLADAGDVMGLLFTVGYDFLVL